MKDNTVLILDGYGNAGLAIARLLVSQTKVGIILAGRTGDRAQRAAQQLNAEFKTDCVSGMQVNAASKESLIQAFQQVGIVVVASSTIEFTQIVAEAALEAGIDYFDVQISATAKRQALEALRERILSSGRCFITDGGYRPASRPQWCATPPPKSLSSNRRRSPRSSRSTGKNENTLHPPPPNLWMS